MRSRNILTVLVALLFVPAVQAATNNTAPDLMSSLIDGWDGLPPQVQPRLYWLKDHYNSGGKNENE